MADYFGPPSSTVYVLADTCECLLGGSADATDDPGIVIAIDRIAESEMALLLKSLRHAGCYGCGYCVRCGGSTSDYPTMFYVRNDEQLRQDKAEYIRLWAEYRQRESHPESLQGWQERIRDFSRKADAFLKEMKAINDADLSRLGKLWEEDLMRIVQPQTPDGQSAGNQQPANPFCEERVTQSQPEAYPKGENAAGGVTDENPENSTAEYQFPRTHRDKDTNAPLYSMKPGWIFCWENRDVKLTAIPWRMLDHLLKTRTAEEDDLIQAVWGHDSEKSANTVRSTLTTLRKRLLEENIPITISQDRGYIILTIDRE